MLLAVVGLGKLGAPLAAVLAAKGFDVLGVDVDARVAQLVGEGRAPVEEPGLEALLRSGRARLRTTTALAEAARADMSILLVPTPSDERGAFSNAHVFDAVEQIGRALADESTYHVLVVGSTVMPGSCDGEIRTLLEASSGRRVGETIGLCYSPEFIALGSVIRDLTRPDMVLIGESDSRAGDVAERVYTAVCENDPPVRRLSLIDAELAKIAVNTYVTMKISYANTLAAICERLPGADVDAVTDAVGLDTRIGAKYLRGAIAYGGPCFPRDNRAFAALARNLAVEPLLAEATDSVNLAQVERLAGIVRSHASNGDKIGILGLSYKPDTVVVEESPGIALAHSLHVSGHEVYIHDPAALEPALSRLEGVARACDDVDELVAACDVVVITTPWPEFARVLAETSTRRERAPLVIDCWRLLRGVQHRLDVVELGRTLEQPTAVRT